MSAEANGGTLGDPEGILSQDIKQWARTPVVVSSMDIPVTSVTKEPSTVGRSAAAVFVITNEMIRRSGATDIPAALGRTAGVHVAPIGQYLVSDGPRVGGLKVRGTEVDIVRRLDALEP